MDVSSNNNSITNPGEYNEVIAVAYVATRAKMKDDDNRIPYMQDPLVIKKNKEIKFNIFHLCGLLFVSYDKAQQCIGLTQFIE
jgi:hypothetical protein